MSLLALWKAALADHSNFLERVIAMLEENAIRYCVIGGVLNAYAEPLFTADLDIVIATDQLEEARARAAREFRVREFPYSINVYDPDSKLQVQFHRRPEMRLVDAFPDPRDEAPVELRRFVFIDEASDE